MIRFFDIFFSLFGLLFGLPLLLLLALIGLFDTGSPIFRQERVGKQRIPFMLVKFRTMKKNTASVATHLADASCITPFGRFLRRSKLDELPQFWNVLLGDMSLVGPRPCLPSQEELLNVREEYQVFSARPGITGLAQIQNIDMSTPTKLALTDKEMLESLTLVKYFFYIFITILGKGRGDNVFPIK